MHAAVYLARENFGCPGLEGCAFDADEGGVFSVTLEDALGEMTDLDGAGDMEWDVDGRFARFLARRGGNHGWMVAAAAIHAAYTRMRGGGVPFSRSDLLERVNSTCRGFSREHLSLVYEEMFPLLRNDEDR